VKTGRIKNKESIERENTEMATKNEVYKCEICGNIVEVLHGGKGALVCCGSPMKLMTENTVDAAKEKHVPVATTDDMGTVIKVGDVAHPMTEEHHIEWIQLLCPTGKHNVKHFLKPGDAPETSFKLPNTKGWKVRSYCNLHGLWSNEI